MTQDYVISKIKQALETTRGNETKARQQIIAWTYEDTKLLHDLAKPHMTGIIAHAISRVKRMQERGEETIQPEPVLAPISDPELDGTFGIELLKAIAGDNRTKFGMDVGERNAPKRAAASQQHVDALKLMAQKGKSRK